MLVYAGTRWSHWPGADQRPGSAETLRTRQNRPRHRRNDQALARWPIACSTSARSPAWQRLNARCGSESRSLVRRSPTGTCQCSRGFAMPRNPRSRMVATLLASSTASSPYSVRSSCAWQLPGPYAAVAPHRSPQTVEIARPWAVWTWRLASYRTFWLAHPLPSLHPGRQPVDHDRLAGQGQLLEQLAKVRNGGDEGAVRLAVPE
jgi:hypothetical protein